MKIIINAISGKRKVGGGFQIACNFIRMAKDNLDADWYFFVSDEIDAAIGKDFNEIKETKYFVFPTQPNLRSYCQVQNKINELIRRIQPELVYSILAPSYMKFRCREVMRCTNPWVNNQYLPKYVLDVVPKKTKLRLWLTKHISHYYMRKADFFVTQSSAAARGINSITHIGMSNIKVVPNVLPAVYAGYNVNKKMSNIFNIAYITVPHPHKNIEIIPKVAALLKNKYGVENFCFYITIPESDKTFLEVFDKALTNNNVKDKVLNFGYRTQEQLIDIYEKCKLCFFPSLLETFSVSLVEAMFFKLPIVATDIDFNREVAGDASLYFDPTNAEDAAEQIARLMKDKELYSKLLSAGEERVKKFDNYNRHFQETVNFLKRAASEDHSLKK